MQIQAIRNQAQFEEIDYVFLKGVLSAYSQPRNKIQNLLRKKDLIRVKKGLYIFGPHARRGPYSREHLANLIYGPSCLSLEYALGFHGLIPERVETLTSVTTKRNKQFSTPVGYFSYQYLNPKNYFLGVDQINLSGRQILIASPEKTVVDFIALTKEKLNTVDQIYEYFFSNLRFDKQAFQKLDIMKLKKLVRQYSKRSFETFLKFLESVK